MLGKVALGRMMEEEVKVGGSSVCLVGAECFMCVVFVVGLVCVVCCVCCVWVSVCCVWCLFFACFWVFFCLLYRAGPVDV